MHYCLICCFRTEKQHWSHVKPNDVRCKDTYVTCDTDCICYILQVVLSFNASSVSQLPGSDPHGLGHLPPAEGTDRLHLCKSPSVAQGKVSLMHAKPSQVGSAGASDSLFLPFRSWDQCALSPLLPMASTSTTPCWLWSSVSPPTSGKTWRSCRIHRLHCCQMLKTIRTRF